MAQWIMVLATEANGDSCSHIKVEEENNSTKVSSEHHTLLWHPCSPPITFLHT